jgi:DNA-binding NarL/FixJ family response regulator
MPRAIVPARLFLIAAVRVYCDTLAQRLSEDGFGTVVGAGLTARGALRAIVELRPEIVLVDVSPRGTLGDVRCLAAAAPGVRIVALAASETIHHAAACAEAGIVGCVPRDASFSELVATLRRVRVGEAPSQPSRTVTGLLRSLAERNGPIVAPELTPREMEILACLDRGLSNMEIARLLHIELPTVKNHVHHILEKLHVHRRGQAAAMAAGRLPRSFISP